MWLNKVVYRQVFLLLYQYADYENLHEFRKPTDEKRVENMGLKETGV